MVVWWEGDDGKGEVVEWVGREDVEAMRRKSDVNSILLKKIKHVRK